MTTAAAKVTGSSNLEPFFFLKISGLPYYFCSTINPSSTAYGSLAWNPPTGYATGFCKRGMMLPDDSVEQKVPDLIGGICSPERIRLKLLDFQDPDHPGFNYFARLFAPGRALSDTTLTVGELYAGMTTASSSLLVKTSTAFVADSTIHVGPENILLDTVGVLNASGIQALTVDTRNRYPAHVGYPLTPYHRVTRFDTNGLPVNPVPVTTDIITVYGRVAALYMGHMRPDGTPEPESNAACLMIGKIQAIDVDDDGTNYQLTIESLTADLDKGQVAPDLAADIIKPGLYLGTGVHPDWLQFEMELSSTVAIQVSIPSATYDANSLVLAVNAALVAAGLPGSRLTYNSDNRFVFQNYGATSSYRVRVARTPTGTSAYTATPGGASLLYVLGFDPEGTAFESDKNLQVTTSGSYYQIFATRPMAKVFVPTERNASTGVAIPLTAEQSTTFFNTTQSAVGPAQAYVRLGDGKVVTLVSKSAGTNSLYIGYSVIHSAGGSTFYYATDEATVEQVVLLGGPRIKSLAQLLCSTSAVASDTEFNVFNEGVGLGWNSIVTKADWRAGHLDGNATIGNMVIDRNTTFGELFKPIARERGLFIMWDPITGTYRLRKIQLPSQSAAALSPSSASTFVFSESNRVSPTHRSRMQQDRSSMRSSWTVKRGYNWSTKEFEDGSFTFNNTYARSFFPNGMRSEEIEDKTLFLVRPNIQTSTDDVLAAFIASMIDHTFLYVFPWQKILRSVNKTGLMLSPGTYHQLIDNTLVNPFTGASGITAADGVYAFLAGVSKNYATGECSADLMLFATSGAGLVSSWSPCGLVDYDAASHGYNAGTKVLTMLSHYTAQAGKYDGADFAVGDKVRVCARDWSDASANSEDDTIAAIATNGSTITLTTGLLGFSSAVESIVQLRQYGDATTSRQTGAGRVTWQGSATTLLIDASTGSRIMKWQ